MMPHSPEEMMERLDAVVAADPRRKQTTDEAMSLLAASASRIPMVHRTGKDRPWRTIFQSHQICGNPVCTKWEQDSLKVDRAAYFFWGCGAYPKGSVAVLMNVPVDAAFSAAPFDSGGCAKGLFIEAGREMSEAQRNAALDEYTLTESNSFVRYGVRYIASHFVDPLDYIRRPQESEPDYKSYHGLESKLRDRRAWSVEIRVHGDLPISPKKSVRVIVQDRSLVDEFMADERMEPYLGLIRVASPDGEHGFSGAIAQEVLKQMETGK